MYLSFNASLFLVVLYFFFHLFPTLQRHLSFNQDLTQQQNKNLNYELWINFVTMNMMNKINNNNGTINRLINHRVSSRWACLAFLILARKSWRRKFDAKNASSSFVSRWSNWNWILLRLGDDDVTTFLFRSCFLGAGGHFVIGGILCSSDVGVLNPSSSSSTSTDSVVRCSCFAGVLMWSAPFLCCSCCGWSWSAWSWSEGCWGFSNVGFWVWSSWSWWKQGSELETFRPEIRLTSFDSMKDDWDDEDMGINDGKRRLMI